MARLGSGWFERRSSRMRTDEYLAVHVRRVVREARLLEDGVILMGGVLARLEWTPCYFGGFRPYFRCPRCKRRCCIVYKFKSDSKGCVSYGCQKCLNMVHPVENEGKLERAARRSNKTLNRQKYDPSRVEGKPLWMRWPTWKRLSDEVAESFMARLEYHDKIITLLRYLDSPKRSFKRNK